MAATASVVEASTKWVAPNWRASPSLEAMVSTAMIRLAPARRRPWITLSPTPPDAEDGRGLAGLHLGPVEHRARRR